MDGQFSETCFRVSQQRHICDYSVDVIAPRRPAQTVGKDLQKVFVRIQHLLRYNCLCLDLPFAQRRYQNPDEAGVAHLVVQTLDFLPSHSKERLNVNPNLATLRR